MSGSNWANPPPLCVCFTHSCVRPLSGSRFQHNERDGPLGAQQGGHPHVRRVEEAGHGGGDGEKWVCVSLRRRPRWSSRQRRRSITVFLCFSLFVYLLFSERWVFFSLPVLLHLPVSVTISLSRSLSFSLEPTCCVQRSVRSRALRNPRCCLFVSSERLRPRLRASCFKRLWSQCHPASVQVSPSTPPPAAARCRWRRSRRTSRITTPPSSVAPRYCQPTVRPRSETHTHSWRCQVL